MTYMPPIEVVDAADPDAPNRTIRRARRVDPVNALKLEGREMAAVNRLRDDADIARGAREDAGGGGLAHWQRSHYPARQIDAVTSLTGALMAMGPIASPVVCAVVLEWRSLRDVAEGRMSRETARDRLRLGLERLIEYYDS